MIYPTEDRAKEVAAELNAWRHHGRHVVEKEGNGWRVRRWSPDAHEADRMAAYIDQQHQAAVESYPVSEEH